MGAKQAAFR